jgi:hypothetical protein
MILSVKVRHFNSVTARKRLQSKELEGLVEFLMDLYLGCAHKLSMKKVFQSIQSLKCKDAL